MARRLNAKDKNFAADFEALLFTRNDAEEDVAAQVKGIIADVRKRGDDALVELSNKFDRANVTLETLKLSAADIDAAEITPAQQAAIETAAKRIEVYHRRQIPEDASFTDDTGAKLGWRWTAVDSVGLYVPGGTASYPSSVLMNAIPAHVAGVKRIVMVTPASGGKINPLVLAAAKRAGVSEIFRIGGAQAVAALAYGTKQIAPVDKIVGPGNAWVAAAKREVFGQVGIDSIAGPSEILVIADGANDPDWIAADLLSQAEHDASSQSILITDDAAFADKVAAAAERALAILPRKDIAGKSWNENGGIIVVEKLEDAAALSDRFAPEHLEIATADPEALLAKVRHAGAIFLGRHTPEAMGDYIAGPNHVLPTSRSARFSSGLSVLDFMKRTTLLSLDSAAINALGPEAITLAEAEGLEAHARSIAARLKSQMSEAASSYRLSAITLDETSGVTAHKMIAQEREVAICDILESNSFRLEGSSGGPYHLTLGAEENRLVFDIKLEDGSDHGRVMLSLAPLRSVIKDYFLICDSYYKAIRTAQPHQIEALDMGRRGLHDEGSTLLQKRLEGKIETDFATARRLFTLICVMHLKG